MLLNTLQKKEKSQTNNLSFYAKHLEKEVQKKLKSSRRKWTTKIKTETNKDENTSNRESQFLKKFALGKHSKIDIPLAILSKKKRRHKLSISIMKQGTTRLTQETLKGWLRNTADNSKCIRRHGWNRLIFLKTQITTTHPV